MMDRSREAFTTPAHEREKMHEVKTIAPSGFGFGEGSISLRTRLESGELDTSSLAKAIDIIATHPEVFVTVDEDAVDDGCSDGRSVHRIYRFLDTSTGEVQTFSRSLRRAKIFGGGLIAASSMWRAADGHPDGKTLDGDRRFIAEELRKRHIQYGAHIDSHASGEQCGCGAIDNYESISRNVLRYKPQILQSLELLYGEALDNNAQAIASVYTSYASLDESYFAGMTGRQTIQTIESDGAVVKELEGKHREAIVVLNSVEGTTFDQERFRNILHSSSLSPEFEVFAIDVWRGRMYAGVIADIARQSDMTNATISGQVAYADFLIRTLAVSATLTAGDQPVIMHQRIPAFSR